MIYAFIKDYEDQYPVKTMAKILNVSRSGYYDWLNRKPSNRAIETELLDTEIRRIAKEGRYTYGAKKIQEKLRKENRHHGEKRIRKRMKENNILVKRVRKSKRTTISDLSHEVAENLLNRNFEVSAPNECWAGDITYIQTVSGWVYLAIVIDLFSRKIVGWALSTSMETTLVSRAFLSAYNKRQPSPRLMFHSDRGVQYTSKAFRLLLKERGVIQSMSRKGNCWDNAVVESFNGILKLEWLYASKKMPLDIHDVKLAVFDYIEIFYNRARIHSTLGYLTPEEFENCQSRKKA